MKGEAISEKTGDIYFPQRFFFKEKLSLQAPDSYHLK